MRSQASDCLGPGGMFQSQGNARAEAQGRSGWQFKEQREHQCGCSRGEGRWGGNGGAGSTGRPSLSFQVCWEGSRAFWVLEPHGRKVMVPGPERWPWGRRG